MSDQFSLKDKTVLITGASSGIGKQIAISCAAAGAKVILTGRNTAKLQEILDTLKEQDHSLIEGDLSDPDFINEICKTLPVLDGLVQSAGLMKLIPLKFIKAADIDEIFSINLRAPILLVATLQKLKKLNPYSSIVLLSSINGAVIGSMANSVYGASKGGLQSFCKASSLELAKNKIRINCIAPGMVETEGTDKIGEHVSAENIEEDKKKYPLSRYGNTTDISSACIFLLSPSSGWITGTTMIIDGGYTAT